MVLYGKDRLKSRLDDISAKGRLSHAIMYSGHRGSGRKTMALYTAQLFLCENGNACGKCVTCRNIEHRQHPDVIFVKEKCNGKYQMKEFRLVLKDMAIYPNNGKYKIYVFEDCDTMLAQPLNALLKRIEEPESHLKFVFTCENKNVIPETILSRVTEFEVPDTPVDDCKKCLIDKGTSPKQAGELSAMFSGNIGECLDVLNGGDEAKLVEIARKAADAFGKRDYITACAALSETTVRADFSRVFEYLSKILRDALAIKVGAAPETFAVKEAKCIAEEYSEEEILAKIDAAMEICADEQRNINLALSAAYFMGF